ncbi:Zn-ribbon domain-containing OB-fold protein [Iamia sp.]|uniref:Zn-ribbon domain-containing OB-fold protein n=1 Tax=Iamia sp. TaxID=2722710 RepID=UPI002C1C410B|nr:OB-fold domain-containing protein [Iamia sp.]HXH59288.1 OB-fold domain-containing protein [Iamia sp.]
MASGQSTSTMELLYRRSLGPVVGAFLTALRDQTVLASRTAAGWVICPPLEYDPESGDAVDELVPVGPDGVVTGWSWVFEPLRKHPLDRPFAWALVQLDGPDTAMVHALDAGDPASVHTGMRVRVRWATERTGHITDIACFEPEEG